MTPACIIDERHGFNAQVLLLEQKPTARVFFCFKLPQLHSTQLQTTWIKHEICGFKLVCVQDCRILQLTKKLIAVPFVASWIVSFGIHILGDTLSNIFLEVVEDFWSVCQFAVVDSEPVFQSVESFHATLKSGPLTILALNLSEGASWAP